MSISTTPIETFKPGDEVELSQLGIRLGLTMQNGGRGGVVVRQTDDKKSVVVRRYPGSMGVTYNARFWRKMPRLTQAEIEEAGKLA